MPWKQKTSVCCTTYLDPVRRRRLGLLGQEKGLRFMKEKSSQKGISVPQKSPATWTCTPVRVLMKGGPVRSAVQSPKWPKKLRNLSSAPFVAWAKALRPNWKNTFAEFMMERSLISALFVMLVLQTKSQSLTCCQFMEKEIESNVTRVIPLSLRWLIRTSMLNMLIKESDSNVTRATCLSLWRVVCTSMPGQLIKESDTNVTFVSLLMEKNKIWKDMWNRLILIL